jgi:long-chain fatty acid transport protein
MAMETAMATRTRSFLSGGVAAIALASLVAPARAGGLARPNPVSARSVGMGGAFSAVADDPTALHFNPAGLALQTRSNVLIGGEFVVAPRTYDPNFETCDTDPSNAICQSQSPTSPVRPLPSLGFATRLTDESGIPSRLAFGIGFWNTFGGQLKYEDDPEIPGTLQETRNAVLELVPGVAYQVNDVMAIGAAFRLGIGLFDSVANERPNDATLSATGVGAGGTFGIMIRPSDALRLAGYYRTALSVTTNGDGFIEGGVGDVEVEFVQRWPQQFGFATAYQATDSVLLAAQFDWHGWSRVNEVRPVYKGQLALTEQAKIPTDWDNNIQLHLGAMITPADAVELRAGYTFDTTAVTPRLRERQFLDGDSHFVAVGGSYYVTSSFRVDAAFELGPGGTVTIEDNAAEARDGNWPARANVSPGDHSGELYTLELALQYLY